MTEEGILSRHLRRMGLQLVDSSLETTRLYWRREFFDATEAEAADPRPFAQVLADRVRARSA